MNHNKAEKSRPRGTFSAADRARHGAIREMFRDWHPSPEELIASGEGPILICTENIGCCAP